MSKTIETVTRLVLVLALAASLVACAAKRPPQRIQHAIQTMNRHMPEYVAEANQSLEATPLSDWRPARLPDGGWGARAIQALSLRLSPMRSTRTRSG